MAPCRTKGRPALAPVFALALLFMLLPLASAHGAAGCFPTARDAIIAKSARGSFDETVAGLRDALIENDLIIVSELRFPDTLSIVVSANDPDASIEVPLRIHVWQRGEDVSVRYREPSTVFAPYPALADLGTELDDLFAAVVSRVTK